jgi:ATP-dependent helicase/nuclease subunit B
VPEAQIYTCPSGTAFLPALARALLDGELAALLPSEAGPLALSSATLLLPTRRATRGLQDAFLAARPNSAVLLPRIRAIAEGNEDAGLIASLATHGGADDVPPAIASIERQLALMQLVVSWARALADAGGDDATAMSAAGISTPAHAARLAADLAMLMDEAETEGADLGKLATLVPDAYSKHWEQTLDFLKIVTEHWPRFLDITGKISAAERRNRLIRDDTRRLRAFPDSGPVIVAGVTGSIPATAELMAAVAAHTRGAIILPGLDTTLDANGWNAIDAHPEHPQFGLKKLLTALGIDRASVRRLGPAPSEINVTRHHFFSQALRPARTTDQWHAYTKRADREALTAALAGVALIETPTAQDEAETIALILREALEDPKQTAALVSPDRLLARRVATRLEAWGIEVDDSAGRPFAKTVPGAFLDLIAATIAEDFAPARVAALLKHPLTRLGLPAVKVRRAARFIELAAFRTAYLGRGLTGIAGALTAARQETSGAAAGSQRRHVAVRRLWEEDWTLAEDVLRRFEAALTPWTTLAADPAPRPLRDYARRHIAVAEELAKLEPDADGNAPPPPLWADEAGDMAAELFAGFLDPETAQPQITAADWPDLYRTLIAGANVRARLPVHPRLAIWGPFESRLQQPDVVVLGSLVDGTWPELANPGAWLNRDMRRTLGLPAPEVKTGYAAHDFMSLLGAKRVVLTRALKVGGVPTVPSRWLMRIRALLGGLGLVDVLASPSPYLAWARTRDAIAGRPAPCRQPKPAPPVALRPRQLSVTTIEKWIANPYAIFANRILGLEPLDPLGAPPTSALKGSLVHEALGAFAKQYPAALPPDIARELTHAIEAALATHAGDPRVAAFWLPRLRRFAMWFAQTEPHLRAGTNRVVSETTGKLVLAAPAGPFTLTARADRIDCRADGALIIDYKTGAIPNPTEVRTGKSPQLPLEAAIALQRGFAGVTAERVAGLSYIRVTGGEPPGAYKSLSFKDTDIASVATSARVSLERLVARFDDPATPYLALRRPAFANAYRFDPFAHLARIKEWSSGDDGEEGAE